jgi:hypothetical protein
MTKKRRLLKFMAWLGVSISVVFVLVAGAIASFPALSSADISPGYILFFREAGFSVEPSFGLGIFRIGHLDPSNGSLQMQGRCLLRYEPQSSIGLACSVQGGVAYRPLLGAPRVLGGEPTRLHNVEIEDGRFCVTQLGVISGGQGRIVLSSVDGRETEVCSLACRTIVGCGDREVVYTRRIHDRDEVVVLDLDGLTEDVLYRSREFLFVSAADWSSKRLILRDGRESLLMVDGRIDDSYVKNNSALSSQIAGPFLVHQEFGGQVAVVSQQENTVVSSVVEPGDLVLIVRVSG